MKRFVLALAMVFSTPAWAEDPAVMVLTGTGEISATPDMATVSLGVVAESETAQEALAENSAALAGVLAVLQNAGIDAPDIQTTRFDVQPLWQNRSYSGSGGSSDPARISGYVVTNILNVQVRDLTILGTVLDAAAGAGANEFNGIQFGLQDAAPLVDQARQAAVADAQARAALYSEAAGVDILGILSITEAGSGGGPRPEMMAMATRSSVPVAEGEVTISASVQITYEIDG